MPPFVLIVAVAAVAIVLGIEYLFVPGQYLPLVMTLTAVIVLATGAAVARGVWFLERKRQRDVRAVDLQSRLDAAFRRDPRTNAVPVTPVVEAPVRRSGTTTIELQGEVPSAEVREAVVEIVNREAAQVCRRYEIRERLHVPGDAAA